MSELTGDPTVRGHRAARPVIRVATSADRAGVLDLGGRCSGETMRRRFHGAVVGFPVSYLDRILHPGSGADNLVALVDGRIVALATFQPTAPGQGEVAVLVEDAWQHHHLGTRLVVRLGGRARARHQELITASVMTDNLAALGLLHRTATHGAVTFDGAALTVSVPLTAVA